MKKLRICLCLFVTVLSSGFALPLVSDQGGESQAYEGGELDAISNALIEKGTNRLARFIFDYANTGSKSSSYGASSNAGSGFDLGKNLLNLDINTNTVTEGIFKPDNIAIHIGQNAFNFVASSIAWGIAGAIYSATNSNSGRSSDSIPSYLPTTGSHPTYYTHGTGKALDNFNPSEIIGLHHHQKNLEAQSIAAATASSSISSNSAQRRNLQLEPSGDDQYSSYHDKMLMKRHSLNSETLSNPIVGIQTKHRSGDNSGSRIKRLRKVIRKNQSTSEN